MFEKFKAIFAEKPKDKDNTKIIDFGPKENLQRQLDTLPAVYDITLGAAFDHPKDSTWMQSRFKLMNHYSRKAATAAWYAIQYKMRYYYDQDKRAMRLSDMFMQERNRHLIDGYKVCKDFENNIWRAENDQTCICKPIQIAIKEDLVTSFGLTIMVENFMLFNNVRFDFLDYGTGKAPAFGGDRALALLAGSVSILQEGVSIPYGTEARHGAPVLASTASNQIAEIGIRDSISGKLYSRSVFPSGKIIDHVQNFDAYSVLHIAQLKAL